MTGTTACVVLVTKDLIVCSNSGDSRAVLCRDAKAIALSEDHKPNNDEEQKRITKANHFVEDERVDGNLALSRAIGDFQYKDMAHLSAAEQAVTCNPDLISFKRESADEFIIVACDGIWDCMNNQQCLDYLKPEIKNANKEDSTVPLENLLDKCLADNTDDGIGTDNMTAILIKFKNK